MTPTLKQAVSRLQSGLQTPPSLTLAFYQLLKRLSTLLQLFLKKLSTLCSPPPERDAAYDITYITYSNRL